MVLELAEAASLARSAAVFEGLEVHGRAGGLGGEREKNCIEGSAALMVERYAAAAPELPLLFAYYALAYHCAYRADAAKSIWSLHAGALAVVKDGLRAGRAPRAARHGPPRAAQRLRAALPRGGDVL